MPDRDSIPIKYALYSHFGYAERADFETWKSAEGEEDETLYGNLSGVRYLARHFDGLHDLLGSPGYEGLLVLFYSSGFEECLDGIAEGLSRDELLGRYERLRFAHRVGRHVENLLRRHGGLASRVRFLTPIDFFGVFGRMRGLPAQQLRLWFVGLKRGIRYDTPKIAEALVRLRLLGTGVPVFRLDQDVLFRGEENEHVPNLALFKPIASCLKAFEIRRDDPDIATFMFSASYTTRDLAVPGEAREFLSWSRAFPTRVFPALPMDPHLAHLAGSSEDPYTWTDYVQETFDPRLACRFYGLDPEHLRTRGVGGIARWGANPLVSVVSGALLCISDGAILDLPPFSNLSLNVSWIDDHLKYCLHRELRHFSSIRFKVEPLLSEARLDMVMVEKGRPGISNLARYVFGDYLPTLLWGMVMDAWITPDPLLKYRPDTLDEESRAAGERIPRTGPSQALLPAALQEALRKGTFTEEDRVDLEVRLEEAALARITRVRREFADLTDGKRETFASLWAKGEVARVFPELPDYCYGMTQPRFEFGPEITTLGQLDGYLHRRLNTLVRDATEYIEWTLNWPKIVQMVRSVEQGTLRTDMSWRAG